MSTLISRTSSVAAIAKTPSLKVSSRVVPLVHAARKVAHAVDGGSSASPVTFVLAIVAAVLAGNRTDSFWYGLLAFFVAMGAGRVLGAIVRGRLERRSTRRSGRRRDGLRLSLRRLGLPPWATSSSPDRRVADEEALRGLSRAARLHVRVELALGRPRRAAALAGRSAHRLEVGVQQVLEHHALAARALVLAEPSATSSTEPMSARCA